MTKRAFVGKVVLWFGEKTVDTRIRLSSRSDAHLVMRLWAAGCFGQARGSCFSLEAVQTLSPNAPLSVVLFQKGQDKKWRISGPAAAFLAANERGEDATNAILKYWEKRILESGDLASWSETLPKDMVEALKEFEQQQETAVKKLDDFIELAKAIE